MIKVAILTLSDKGSKGQREDTSGPAIEKLITRMNAEIVHAEILPDEKSLIKKKLTSLCKKAM